MNADGAFGRTGEILRAGGKVLLALDSLGRAVVALVHAALGTDPPFPLYTIEGGGLMYQVTTDTPPTKCGLLPFSVHDRAGITVNRDQYRVAFVSTHPDVMIAADPDDAANEEKCQISFTDTTDDGQSSVATVSAEIRRKADDFLLGVFADVFTVSPGSAVSVVGGGLKVEGLTPVTDQPSDPAVPPAG